MTSREALSTSQDYSWFSLIQQNAVAQDSFILLAQNFTKVLISALPRLKLGFRYSVSLEAFLRILHDYLGFTSKLNRVFKVFGYFHTGARVADNWRTDTTYSLLKFISLWSYGVFALVDFVSLVRFIQSGK
jgi:hypothetical protein